MIFQDKFIYIENELQKKICFSNKIFYDYTYKIVDILKNFIDSKQISKEFISIYNFNSDIIIAKKKKKEGMAVLIRIT